MNYDQRISWLIVGCAIGYIIRMLQDIKQEVHEVDELVKKNGPRRNEEGFARFPIVLDVLIIFLAGLTIWSFTRGEQATDEANKATAAVTAQNERIEKITSCNLEFTAKTIRALNARTTYTADQLQANVAVMQSQLEFFQKLLIIPPLPETVRRALAEQYVSDVQTFVEVSDKQAQTTTNNAYPTNEELAECLGAELTKEKEQENDERESGTG